MFDKPTVNMDGVGTTYLYQMDMMIQWEIIQMK